MKTVTFIMGVLFVVGSTGAEFALEVDGGNPLQANLFTDGEFGAVFIGSIGGPVVAEGIEPPDLVWPCVIEPELPDPYGDFVSFFFVTYVDSVDPEINLQSGLVGTFTADIADVPVTLMMMNADDLSVMQGVVLTPEPMSLALLGLGGLLVRRRR